MARTQTQYKPHRMPEEFILWNELPKAVYSDLNLMDSFHSKIQNDPKIRLMNIFNASNRKGMN